MERVKNRVAVITGVTGIIGLGLARRLVQDKWKVYGISLRKQEFLPEEVHHIAVDLTDKEASQTALYALTDVRYAFYAAFQVMPTAIENQQINKSMMENFIDGLPANLNHFVFVQGSAYYSGSFDVHAIELAMPYKETLSRPPEGDLPHYLMEELMFDRAAKLGYKWSIPRPSIIIGFAPYSWINLASCIAVHATICKFLEKPFKFPGNIAQYNHLQDATDADLLAKHIVWEVTTPAAANQIFNIVNGDLFRWRSLWPELAEYFNVKPEGPSEEPFDWEKYMTGKEEVWEKIIKKYDLKKTNLEDLFIPKMFSVLISLSEVLISDMTKSREMGFLEYESTGKSYFRAFDEMRAKKYIP